MSNPPNILAKFRSYSYHHILMVCNNTETANALTDISEITAFQRVPNVPDSERYAYRTINGDENKKYVVLIDGTKDARFYITGAWWESIISMENYIGENEIPQSTSMSLEGELEIVEPLGASFLNVITKICDTLETDPVGLVFVLKTIFIGHNGDGTIELISNIKPLLFINYDITAVFDSSGAKYKFAFVGAINGLGKLPHAQRIFSGISFSIKTGDTLGKTLSETITKEVNNAYKKYKKQAILEFAKTLFEEEQRKGKTLSAEEAVAEATKFLEENYREVEYKIIADDYDNDRYIAGDNEEVRIKTKQEVGSFNFGNDIGVEELIKRVMNSSTGVIDDGLGVGTDEGKRYIYKIVSGLKSTVDKFIVEYHVKKYELIMTPYELAAKGETITPRPGQAIEFNYIFTGKNVDIKSFDIRMEMGMAFFQIAATTDSIPNGNSVMDGLNSHAVPPGSALSAAASSGKQRKATPLFLGSQIKQQITRNTKSPVRTASFQSLLNRHAALENISVTMSIFGNPRLLDEMQILPNDLEKKEEEIIENESINPNWLQVPTLVKVNIKMPVDSNDVNTEYDDFWYTGYYTLFSVKHIFKDGEFLQDLDLMSIPVADPLIKTEEGVERKPKKVQEEEKEEFIRNAEKILKIDNNEASGDGDTMTVKQRRLTRRGLRSKE